MFLGVDVGVKKSHAAVISGEKVLYIGVFDEWFENFEGFKIKAAGIDAPLSFPKKGFRECERLLLKMGIRLFPPNAPFFKIIGLKGIEIAEMLKKRGIDVYEVYPYASRVFLNIAPKSKKTLKIGKEEILEKLKEFVDVEDVKDHNEIDAIIAALTVKLYYEGKGFLIKGFDGEILVPKPLNRDLQVSLASLLNV
ncbi:DUF429 domain-containing protein [Archaeoglobales archaeon]|nr:MAG: DUF429 domain-containing protein [Archaeoglobales archaeon]